MGLLLPLLVALPAQAAAPANDDRANAIVLSDSLPIMVEGDSTEATAQDPTDPIDSCTGFQDQYTLWYEYTPTETRRLAFDISSDFGAGAGFFRVSDGGGLEQVACAGNATYINVTGGQRYLILVGACCAGPLHGGHFTFSLAQAPPLLDIQVTVDSASYNPRTKTTYLTGTHTCNLTTDYFDMFLTTSQQDKKPPRGVLEDFWEEPNAGPCSPTTTKWSSSVVGQAYLPTSLNVTVQALGYASANESGDDTTISRTLKLGIHN